MAVSLPVNLFLLLASEEISPQSDCALRSLPRYAYPRLYSSVCDSLLERHAPCSESCFQQGEYGFVAFSSPTGHFASLVFGRWSPEICWIVCCWLGQILEGI